MRNRSAGYVAGRRATITMNGTGYTNPSNFRKGRKTSAPRSPMNFVATPQKTVYSGANTFSSMRDFRHPNMKGLFR